MEKVRTKLLTVPAPLRIALLARGQLSATYIPTAETGWSVLRVRVGNAAPENFKSLDEVFMALVEES